MTHYDEFGLPPTATLEEIQRAHRSLAKLLHPDRIQDPAARRVAESQLKRVNGIYSILADPSRRLHYDRQYSVRSPAPNTRMMLALGAARSGWQTPMVTAILSLAAGFQIATWWQSRAEATELAAHQRTAVSQLAAASSVLSPQTAAGHPPAERASAILADTRELRRMLNQVISERDQALAKLSAINPAPLPAPVAVLSPSKAAQPAPPAESQRLAAGASGSQLNAATERAGDPSLTGTWIYSASSRQANPSDQYAAEYIELQLTERDGNLWGRYRARYKVPDRAISPEVRFYFEGAADGDRRYGWQGDADAAGEVQLRLLSENSMSLNWFTSQLGRNLMLGSGSAVLVRMRKN